MGNAKRKVGGVIIMRPNHNNYGTSLQGFATVKIVQKLGYDLRIIRYNKQRTLGEMFRTLPGLLRSGAVSSLIESWKSARFKKTHPDYSTLIDKRTHAVNQFKQKYFEPLCDYYSGWKSLCKGSTQYDIVFVGSDQVWGPLSLYAGFYNLLFVDKSVPQFSYASSFGKSFILNHQKKGVAKFLNKMDAIGVREIQGKEIVDELSEKKATVVADPTLLLTREEWENAIKKSSAKIDCPYILCYMLGPRLDNRLAVKKLGEQLNMKIVVFRHMDWYEPADDNFGDIPIYEADCLDFISLLKNAAYVVTDSFHCSVFSILFHKQFVTFYRLKPTNRLSSHSRIDSLMKIFGLEKRIVKEDDGVLDQIKQDVDWEKVEQFLGSYRAKSLDFFQNCLEIRR
ncbi:polysaccharide pyruvyl transferase family protein [uncultured Fibrobacter sp.]|uniref:polysaccharide pyruvyl transferase family protein n=1 Tax=uncultured Fibrobacter sp. TaxID=261512 RepID=UPI0025FC1547|nr:polysaccharide pyruvyl transferase family protein [uncultured Fibrobacter sp.]